MVPGNQADLPRKAFSPQPQQGSRPLSQMHPVISSLAQIPRHRPGSKAPSKKDEQSKPKRFPSKLKYQQEEQKPYRQLIQEKRFGSKPRFLSP
mmetsp:Transcript_18193/g.27992  ORF Transcript_18193/g.27992 Transcript_18193/m.27992 type:complete len:93 (-) Transcript_18193:886-1164(-)